MGECKYSYSFNAEINALKKSNDSLNAISFKPKKLPWLKASEMFYHEHFTIAKLLEIYKLLLQKEIEDLQFMMLNVTETDEKIAEEIEGINELY